MDIRMGSLELIRHKSGFFCGISIIETAQINGIHPAIQPQLMQARKEDSRPSSRGHPDFQDVFWLFLPDQAAQKGAFKRGNSEYFMFSPNDALDSLRVV